MNPTALRTCLALGLLAAATACSAPAAVEGVVADQPFALEDQRPDVKPYGNDDVMLVLMDNDGTTLRTVSIDLKGIGSLPVGEAITVGAGAFGDVRPSLDVVQGSLVSETRADGVEILSTGDDAVRSSSVQGSLTLDEVADDFIAGSFHVDLDDGGYLEGSFATAR